MLEASIVLAPDIPLKKALGMVLVIQMGLADSLGALAPPELAVHFNWPNTIKVNGALCGKTFYQASLQDENTIPEWLVLGFKIPFLWDKGMEAGDNPDETVLSNEGCIDMTPHSLLESWSNLGENIKWPETGKFMGLDENGNMILRNSKQTLVKNLSHYMET